MGIVSKTREIFVFIQWLNMGGVIVVYRHFQQSINFKMTTRRHGEDKPGQLYHTDQ